MTFVHLHSPHARPSDTDLCLVIQGDRILLGQAASASAGLPSMQRVRGWAGDAPSAFHVGTLAGQPCWCLDVKDPSTPPPPDCEWHETRAAIATLEPAAAHAIHCARQLLWWERRHRFCGTCGTPTVVADEERVRRCPACNAHYFPTAAPAVIVAVTRGDEILLAHNRNFRPGLFSTLAGFIDPGETAEQAISREIREEVGIAVSNPRYVASQPWTFPNSLMLGFRATYAGGDIAVDGKEIETAAWFGRDALPEIPRPGTIARLLIDGWRTAEGG